MKLTLAMGTAYHAESTCVPGGRGLVAPQNEVAAHAIAMTVSAILRQKRKRRTPPAPTGLGVSATMPDYGARLTDDRLLRPPPVGIFRRSLPLHGIHHAPETIAEICSTGVALATAIIGQPGSVSVLS